MKLETPLGPEYMFSLFYSVIDKEILFKTALDRCVEHGIAPDIFTAANFLGENEALAGRILLNPRIMPGCLILHHDCR